MDVIIFMTLLQVIISVVFIFMILEEKKTITSLIEIKKQMDKEFYYRHSKRNQNGKFVKKEDEINGN